MTSVGSARPGTGPCAEASAKSESTTALELWSQRDHADGQAEEDDPASHGPWAQVCSDRVVVDGQRLGRLAHVARSRPTVTRPRLVSTALDERAVRRRDTVQLAGQRLSGDRIERRAEAFGDGLVHAQPEVDPIVELETGRRRSSWIARWISRTSPSGATRR